MKKERKFKKIGSLLLILVLFGGFLTLPPLTVHADPFVTLTFTGTITEVGEQCQPPEEFADAVVGDSWTLTYTFDASATDVDGSPTAGQYQNLITYMTLEIGSNTVSGTPGQAIPGELLSAIFVNRGTSSADYGVEAGLPDNSAWALVTLKDDTGTPFVDDSLPLSIPTPLETKFPTLRHFSLRAMGSTLICIEGTVEDISGRTLTDNVEDQITVLEELEVPEEAEKEIKKAIKDLKNVIKKLEEGDFEGAFFKLQRAVEHLRDAQNDGADVQDIIDIIIEYLVGQKIRAWGSSTISTCQPSYYKPYWNFTDEAEMLQSEPLNIELVIEGTLITLTREDKDTPNSYLVFFSVYFEPYYFDEGCIYHFVTRIFVQGDLIWEPSGELTVIP